MSHPNLLRTGTRRSLTGVLTASFVAATGVSSVAASALGITAAAQGQADHLEALRSHAVMASQAAGKVEAVHDTITAETSPPTSSRRRERRRRVRGHRRQRPLRRGDAREVSGVTEQLRAVLGRFRN